MPPKAPKKYTRAFELLRDGPRAPCAIGFPSSRTRTFPNRRAVYVQTGRRNTRRRTPRARGAASRVSGQPRARAPVSAGFGVNLGLPKANPADAAGPVGGRHIPVRAVTNTPVRSCPKTTGLSAPRLGACPARNPPREEPSLLTLGDADVCCASDARPDKAPPEKPGVYPRTLPADQAGARDPARTRTLRGDRLMEAGMENGWEDAAWYKDAIIYQLHVKAFFDSDNDGIGDFKGLTQRLEYIKDLGVTAIWLMPFYPSPQRDDGYDISEYKNVHPDHGTKRDARAFVRKAHAMGLKVITELVVNHTSDQHPWFQRARRAPKGSALRNFYVWSDTTKRYEGTPIIFSDTENSNWAWDDVAGQYYWHRFFSHQPDLNLDNPLVFRAVMGVMRFWLDAGVDGLRLDAVPYLIEREGTGNQGLPETHEILKSMRAEMDARYERRLFLAEANEWPEDLLPYFGDGDECHMAFHFPLMPRVYMAIAQEDRHPIVDIVHQTPEIPDTCQWAIFLRNHDELTLEMVTDRERDYMYQTYGNDPRMRVNVGIRRRLAPMMENDRPRIELLNSLLMSMPGTPIVYYGDEIGMGDNIFLGDRDSVRTPMQWTSDRNAGFSRTEPARLYLPPIMDPVYGYESVNVEAQGRSAGSLLNWMKRLISVRKANQAFGRGTMEFLHPGNRRVLAYLREYEDESILCVANLSRSAQPVELDLARFRGRVPVELLGNSSFPPLGDLPYMVTLPGHSFYWFRLAKDAEPPVWHQESPRLIEPPVLVLPAGRTRPAAEDQGAPLRLPARQLTRLEQEALPNFLGAQRWFAAGEDDVRRVEISTQTGFGSDRLLALLRVPVGENGPEISEPQLYFLPLSAVWGGFNGEGEGSARMPYA